MLASARKLGCWIGDTPALARLDSGLSVFLVSWLSPFAPPAGDRSSSAHSPYLWAASPHLPSLASPALGPAPHAPHAPHSRSRRGGILWEGRFARECRGTRRAQSKTDLPCSMHTLLEEGGGRAGGPLAVRTLEGGDSVDWSIALSRPHTPGSWFQRVNGRCAIKVHGLRSLEIESVGQASGSRCREAPPAPTSSTLSTTNRAAPDQQRCPFPRALPCPPCLVRRAGQRVHGHNTCISVLLLHLGIRSDAAHSPQYKYSKGT